MSIASAPSEIMRPACAIAASVEKKLPPSLKLSGVTFRIPKMVGRCDFDGQAKLTPALPPVLRRAAAWMAWDAVLVSQGRVPSAADSQDAGAMSRRAPERPLRLRSGFHDRAAPRRPCAAAPCVPAAPASPASTLP